MHFSEVRRKCAKSVPREFAKNTVCEKCAARIREKYGIRKVCRVKIENGNIAMCVWLIASYSYLTILTSYTAKGVVALLLCGRFLDHVLKNRALWAEEMPKDCNGYLGVIWRSEM